MTTERPTLAVITGAGASHDSIPRRQVVLPTWQPPLTDTLFDNATFLSEFMPSGPARALAATVAHRLHKTPRPNFEAVITTEYQRSQANPTLRAGFTALRFYLRDLFMDATRKWTREVGGVTNYQWLVREVEAWRGSVDGRVLWITFNYDTMLDEALEDVYQDSFGWGGEPDPQLATYTSSPDWALVKLHGSCDWRRLTRFRLEEYEAASDPVLSQGRLVKAWDAEADPPDGATTYARGKWSSDADGARSLWIPALMAPLAGKSAFECPPTHAKHLFSLLPAVDLIVTIGWRAQEQHLLERLAQMRQNPPDVYSVTQGEDTALTVAEIVRAATSPDDAAASSAAGIVAEGLKHGGFTRLADQRSDLATDLGEWIQRAHDRRGKAGKGPT